jgi:hypothetical protein
MLTYADVCKVLELVVPDVAFTRKLTLLQYADVS